MTMSNNRRRSRKGLKTLLLVLAVIGIVSASFAGGTVYQSVQSTQTTTTVNNPVALRVSMILYSELGYINVSLFNLTNLRAVGTLHATLSNSTIPVMQILTSPYNVAPYREIAIVLYPSVDLRQVGNVNIQA